MTGPQPGRTNLLITMSSEPGKYEEIYLSTKQSYEKNQNSSVLNQNYEENICYFEICFFIITGFLNLFS